MGSTDIKAPLAAVPRFLDLRAPGTDAAEELRASLTAAVPFIAPKFFYDALGSRLFEAICELPEYPLTRAERSVRRAYATSRKRALMRILDEQQRGFVGRGQARLNQWSGDSTAPCVNVNV